MSDRFLTVVFRNPTPDEVSELIYHPKMSASSWSHAMDDRDENDRRFKEVMRIINSTTREQLVELMGEGWLEEFRRVAQ